MEPTANEMLSDVVPSNGMDAQSAIDKVISQRQNVQQTETGLDEAQSAINTVIQQRKSPKAQLNSTFASVSGINPDDAAKAQQIGGAIGVGQDLTMRNPAEVKRIADQKRFEMYDLMESDPILGRQMMRREFASVAHDDIPQLTSVGALFKVAYSAATLSPFPKDVALEISQQYEGTQYQTEEALIYHWMNNNNLEEKDLNEETRKRLKFLEQNAPPPINTYLFGGLSYAAGQARSMAPEVAKYAIAGGVTGGALGLAGGPLAPATVAGGVLTGIGLGATAGVGVITSQIEGGMIYKDLLRSGVPKDVARTLSSIGGTANGLVEIGTLGLATAPFKPLLKKVIGEQIIKRGIKLAKPTAIGAVKTAAKYYAMAEGGEQIQELSQETVSIIVEEIARSYAPGEYESKLATPEGRQELANRYLDVAEQTFKATAIMGSFGPMLNLAVDAKNIRDSAKTKQFLTDLSKNVQATKLKGRSPSALANFVAAQAQGTAAETMYVDAEEMVNVLNQSGLTAQQIDNALPGVREQLSKATSGGDIQIPTAQFAANIVGTKLEAPLMEHARLAPDAISAKQAIARQETMQQDMKDAQVEMAVQEKVNAQFVREAKEIEKVVNDQLVAAGRPPTEAAFAAKLVQARAVTGAARDGITPAQWVAQHPVPTFQSQRQATQQAPAQGSFEQASRADLGLGEQTIRKVDGNLLRKLIRKLAKQDISAEDLINDADLNGLVTEEEVYDLTEREQGMAQAGVTFGSRGATSLPAGFDSGRGTHPLILLARERAKIQASKGFNESNYRSKVVRWAQLEFGDRIAPDGSSVWQNFTEWFGDSKVVDAEGKPMVVYHSTSAKQDFTEFKPGYSGIYGRGIYMSSSIESTNVLASGTYNDKNYDNTRILPLFVSIKNPLVVSKSNFHDQVAAAAGITTEELSKKIAEGRAVRTDTFPMGLEEKDIYTKIIQDAGFDGVEVQFKNYRDGVPEGRLDESYFVAFEPTQIKSAIANVGTFGQQDPNILRQELSTRRPSSVMATEDPLTTLLTISHEQTLRTPEVLAKNVEILKKLTPMRFLDENATPEQQLENFLAQASDNLVALYNLMPPELRERAKLWYPGGRRMLDYISSNTGLSPMQVGGVFAVLSPQKDWYENVTLGNRIIDIVTTQSDFVWDDKMSATAAKLKEVARLAAEEAKVLRKAKAEIALTRAGGLEAMVEQPDWNTTEEAQAELEKEAVKARKVSDRLAKAVEKSEDQEDSAAMKLYDDLKGTTLKELLSDPYKAAVWVRVFDQTFNEQSYKILLPEGGVGETRTTQAGKESSLRWAGYGAVAKAISVIVDGRAENVFYQIGNEHKVRNFYNNLFAPESGRYITIDTHAVAAANFMPLAGTDDTVAHAFGGSAASGETGQSGAYSIYFESYRRAAEAVGVLPREMQSITWEAVRGLFEASKKKTFKPLVKNIWEKYKSGELTQEQAREEIIKLVGGITNPSWAASAYNESPGQTYEGVSAKAASEKSVKVKTIQKSEVLFEVAPDPTDANLSSRWDALDPETKHGISANVAAKIVPEVLKEFGVSGEIIPQVGGWQGKTNPGFALRLESGPLTRQVAKALGHALSQQGMFSISAEKFDGSQESGLISIQLPDGYTEKQVGELYEKLWKLEHNGKQIIQGHSTIDGKMAIINDTGIDTAKLADMIDKHLGGAFEITETKANTAFDSKDTYGSNLQRPASKGLSILGTRRIDSFRQHATRLIDQEVSRAEEAAGKLNQSAVPATFYSALGVEVGKSTTKSASADSWKQQIKGLIAKGVVKEKEVYWSGLDNWLDLQEGKITKEQVQAFLDAGGVKVEVERSEDEQSASELTARQAIANAKEGLGGLLDLELENTFNEYEELVVNNLQNQETAKDRARRVELEEVIDEALDAVDMKMAWEFEAAEEQESASFANVFEPKYAGYQLPGGTNYREALVMLPSDALGTRKIMEGDKVVAIAKNDPYRSAHWDQSNVLVHLRMNDRVDADGKKVLFVEEVQSDWGQEGREKGFSTGQSLEEINVLAKPYLERFYSGKGDMSDVEWTALSAKVAELEKLHNETADRSRIPTAPFIETTSGWLELGLKQILLEAVNGGYDRVAFVDGDQSVQRYRKALTEAVDEVEITRNDDGTYTYSAIKGGKPVQGEQSVSANRINEVFGKAGSKQLLEEADAKPDEIHTIASGDIEIGGEGMRKFYDTIVPQALGKMLKKLGGDKIVEVNIKKSTGKKINAKEYADEAVKLIKGDIDVDEFSDNLGIEEGDIPNVWINELMDLPSRTPKAEARKIAIEFAAKVKDRFAGGKSMTQQGFTVTTALAAQVSQGLPLFQAAEGGARGEYDPIKNLIGIGKNADYSTVAHELAHWYVVDLFRTASDPTASEASRADADILLKWFGIAGDNVDQRLANWNAMTLDEQRRHHEAVAYNWELYLHTGKAPSVELQGVFDRFRRWLTRAYKSIRDDLNEIYRQQFGTDLPFLTDEVRGVFDRMLASEEQIARREAIDNFKGMYQTQEESGMNDATWAAYQAELAEAHEMAVTDLTKATVKQMEWLSGARKGILKTMQAAHNALRRSVQGEESNKMDNEPVRKAERFFKTGRMVDTDGKEIEVLVGNKLNKVDVEGMYPTSTTGLAPVVDLTKLRGMTMEGGLAPDLAAEMFGFSSGDELIRALAELKPFKDELKERTDARMLDEHGGMNTEAEKEEAVNKALANEVRARIVAIENRYLTKVKTPVAVIMQGAKELARTILGRMAIKDIKPRNYVAAEARVAKDKHTAAKAMQSPETAGKSAYTRSFNEQIAAGVEESAAASEALVKSVEAIKRAQAKIDAHKKQYGDVDPAIVAMKASHQQVIQGQLAKEGYKILDEVDKALGYVKRIVSDANRKKMGADHADQIEAILERFGLMGRYVAPTTRTPLATWAQVQQDIGFDIEIPDIVQESVRKNFLELTPEEFQDVIDTVKQIAHTGKTQQLVLTMDRKVTFEKAKTEIVESINANAGGRKAKTRTATTNIGRSIETLTGFFAAHLKAAIVAQIMDGGKDGGPLWNYLIRSANTAGNKETTMRAAATKRISEILDPVFKGGKMGGAGVYFPSVDRSFNRESVLTIALNMGNESNMQRLLDGEGWTLEQVMPIIQSLTAAELNAVQEVWDYSETFKAEIIEKSRRTVGREPNWIEPKPLQVMSADGQMVSLKGGYYPVKYDPRASARSQSLSAADQALRDLKDAHIASTTRRSYTKSRVKEVHDRPLLLNLSGLYSGIGEVIHDLSWHEWLIDSNRLMRSSAFDKAVREQYGVEFKDQITSWIKDVAAGDKGANNAGEMALNYLRQGVSAAGLGFNLMSAVGQITGFAQSVVKVGAKWIGRGIAASASNPSAAIERVYALSSFMANRGSTQFRELNEIKNMVRGENVAMKRVRAGTYFLMMQMQRMVDIPTWIGAYEKQLSINSDEKLAIAIADQAVIDSQGGGMLKDLSAIERGGPIQKLFTVFYSFMNTNLNLAVLKGMTEKNAGKWVAQQTMLWVVPVVTMYMLKKLLTPQSGDDDDKFDLKEMAKELAAEELSFLMGSFMVVREFADAAKIVTGAKTYGTDYRGPAGLRMIGDTYKFATQAAQLEFDTAFRKAAINIIGSSAGLPAAQINRTIDGIEALMEGETENITAPLFGVKKQ